MPVAQVRGGVGARNPQQLIVSVFALYGRGEPRQLAVRRLIELVARLGVDDQAARSALARLKRRGVVLSTRRDGVAAYELNPVLEETFAEGDQRIFAARRALPGDRWLLVAFSVPESQRHLRHQLRKALSRRGFGTVAPGLWIAPGWTSIHLRQELERTGLAEFVEFFEADWLAESDTAQVKQKVATWWDLELLAGLYEEFVAAAKPVERRWKRQPDNVPRDTGKAFADYLPLVTAWRRIPFLDPGLPVDYLPPSWPGVEASVVFGRLHEQLAAAAADYALEMLGNK
jgi:phenylacetic acid degradation operon negative regulatory protein